MSTTSRPGGGPELSPKLVGQGIATIVVVEAVKRAAGPTKRGLLKAKTTAAQYKGMSGRIREESIRSGLLEGSKPWMAAGVVFWGTRALRRALKPAPKVLLREVLQPGERIVITGLPTKSRRGGGKSGRGRRGRMKA